MIYSYGTSTSDFHFVVTYQDGLYWADCYQLSNFHMAEPSFDALGKPPSTIHGGRTFALDLGSSRSRTHRSLTMKLETIIYMLGNRRAQQERWHADALLLRDLFNSDIDVPLPQQERNEKAAVANIAVVSLDHMATRATSTQPNVHYPPVKAGVERYEKLARKRRLVTLSWWDRNMMNLLDRVAREN